MEREKLIEAYMRDRIKKMGGLFFKFTSPGCDGVPDRIAVLPGGRLIFVELKTSAGQLSKVQKYVIGKLIRMDQQVCVIHGMRAAERFLHDLGHYIVTSAEYFADGSDQELEGGDDDRDL